MFKNISQAKAREPGAIPSIVATMVHMAFIEVANA
jgi:hypothetical protein